MAFVITSPCKEEKAGECVEVCPVDCIEEGKDMFYIDPDICIDCGACEAVCPVEAIYMEDEVPDNENEYIALNHKSLKKNKSIKKPLYSSGFLILNFKITIIFF